MSNIDPDKMVDQLTRPIRKTSAFYYVVVLALLMAVCWGLFAWTCQLTRGLQVTGLNNSVAWGVYITNFVFFIGISHAGTLISAILRVSGAEWRRPITRAAEAITVFALVLGASQILFDLGRPDRALNVILYGPLRSPLLWDVVCISVYLLSSIFYLLLPLIPDVAILRDQRLVLGWRKELYRILSFGWDGNPEQKRRLEKTIGIMAVLIIPIAVSVHTVVSWIFGMTIRPMWHSTILGPYFVVGAIFSGIAAIIIAMAVLRKVYHFEGYLKPIHFNYLGLLLLTMTALWFYFTLAEYLTIGYGALPEEWHVFEAKVAGEFALMFWIMVGSMTVAFFLLLFCRSKWPIGGTVAASLFIVVGMWIERYTIVVPTLVKLTGRGYPPGMYYPSWVEWSITGGSIAGFILLYVLFVKLFPIISIWEVEESEEAVVEKLANMKRYFPCVSSAPTES
ncbi:MAG: polysulfide reductase NrfD [Pirellulales bacterium]|nr:polysulfide reductase NrfD [Pirellulales bacterium]